jgi:hypothetical protein
VGVAWLVVGVDSLVGADSLVVDPVLPSVGIGCQMGATGRIAVRTTVVGI